MRRQCVKDAKNRPHLASFQCQTSPQLKRKRSTFSYFSTNVKRWTCLTNFLLNHARVSVTLHLLRLSHGLHLHDIVAVHIHSRRGGRHITRIAQEGKSMENATRQVTVYSRFCVFVGPPRILVARFPTCDPSRKKFKLRLERFEVKTGGVQGRGGGGVRGGGVKGGRVEGSVDVRQR